MTHYQPRPLLGLLLFLLLLSGCATYPMLLIPIESAKNGKVGSETYTMGRQGRHIVLYKSDKTNERNIRTNRRYRFPLTKEDWALFTNADPCHCDGWPNCCDPQISIESRLKDDVLPDDIKGQKIHQVILIPDSRAAMLQTVIFTSDNTLMINRRIIDASDSNLGGELNNYPLQDMPQ